MGLTFWLTNWVVGGVLSSDQWKIGGNRGKWMSRPPHLPKRKSVCYINGSVVPWDTSDSQALEDHIFREICVILGRQDLGELLFEKFKAQNVAPSGGALFNFAKRTGDSWVSNRRFLFFKNITASYITDAALSLQLESSFLARTDEPQFEIVTAFWSGAWQRFCSLKEAEFLGFKATGNFYLHDRAQIALQGNIVKRVRNIEFLRYSPYLYGWIRVRDHFDKKRALLDRCDARFQKQYADELIARVLNEYFKQEETKTIPNWVTEVRNSRFKENNFDSSCSGLARNRAFLNECFLHFKLSENSLDLVCNALNSIPEDLFVESCLEVAASDDRDWRRAAIASLEYNGPKWR